MPSCMMSAENTSIFRTFSSLKNIRSTSSGKIYPFQSFLMKNQVPLTPMLKDHVESWPKSDLSSPDVTDGKLEEHMSKSDENYPERKSPKHDKKWAKKH